MKWVSLQGKNLWIFKREGKAWDAFLGFNDTCPVVWFDDTVRDELRSYPSLPLAFAMNGE